MPARASARQYEHAASGWFGSPPVQQLVRCELRQAAPELERIYGRCGLILRGAPNLPEQPDGHQMHSVLGLVAGPRHLGGDLVADPACLPLDADSFALIHAMHALECAADPQALVAELARVLEPEGVAAFLVFNPLAPMRLRWMRRGLHVIPPHRLGRMVEAAGLEVHLLRHVGVWWRARDALAEADAGALLPGLRSSYLMLARRREAGMTPLRPVRQRVALGARPTPG